MSAKSPQPTHNLFEKLLPVVFGLPWLEILAELWKLGRKLWRGRAHEGMYEVLEHDVTLELMDDQGEWAQVRKRQRVHYVQNNIIAFQDQAWGDGDILINYRCSPGVEVDRYRPGHKTFILISLREVKHRGDTDEFHIEWNMRNGFLRPREQWGSEVNHQMKWYRLQIVFPKKRPPKRLWLFTYLRQQTQELGPDCKWQLPDGRWQISWQTDKPRLHEQYILKWEW